MTADEDRPRRQREPGWWSVYFDALAKTGIVERAIEMVGRPSSKRTYYRYKKEYPVFDRRWDQALETFRLSVAKEPTPET